MWCAQLHARLASVQSSELFQSGIFAFRVTSLGLSVCYVMVLNNLCSVIFILILIKCFGFRCWVSFGNRQPCGALLQEY